jgi:hypothetical protein
MTSSHAPTSYPYPPQGFTAPVVKPLAPMGYPWDGPRYDEYRSSMPDYPMLHASCDHASCDHTQNDGLDEGTSMFSMAPYHQPESISILDPLPSFPDLETLPPWIEPNWEWDGGNMYQSHQVHAATYPQEEVEDDIVARAAILRPEK